MKLSKTLKGVLLSVAFTVFSATSVGAHAQGTEKLVLTEPTHSMDSVPLYVGLAKGIFKEAGLDITLVTSEGGGQHIAAVLTGDADGFVGGPEHIAFSKAKGGKDIRAVVGVAGRANLYFVARAGVDVSPDAPLAETMKGKRILVGTRGGTGYSLLMKLLAAADLDPRTDVEVIEIAAGAGRFAALKAGQGDIAMMQEPFITQGVKMGISQEPFYSFPDQYGPFAWTTLNVPAALIEEKPDTVRKLVEAMQRSLEYTFENKDEVATIVKGEFPGMPDADREASLQRAFESGMWQRDGFMPEAAWTNLQETVQDAGLLSKDIPYDEIFDLRFVTRQ